MDEKLYDLCDWAEIEAIVYSEHDNPHHILGAHVTDDGILFNTFMPGAASVTLNIASKKYEMELADEEGFFAVLIPEKTIPKYTYTVKWIDSDGKETIKSIIDPYCFEPLIDEADINKFENGIYYDVYNKLGSHILKIDGVEGTYFAVWAPNVMRVSLVGDFNNWDGRMHQMRRLGNSGIHEIFIPGVKEGAKYKYELKIRGDITTIKPDPYAFQTEEFPKDASVVTNLDSFKWNDVEWSKKLDKVNCDDAPTSIYEIHLGTWKVDENNKPLGYKEVAPLIADYVKEMGYTHIQLLPIMEYENEQSMGYDVTSYYAPTTRYGSAQDFMYFVNYMHEQNIGVIIEWTPAAFANQERGLIKFDGTCLYEHENPQRGIHPQFGTRLFNHARPQVSNFLIANAMFWADKYHIDGIRISALGTICYLDYMRKPGQWTPNIYGGNENIEGLEFIKHLNSMMKKKFPNVFMIANDEVKVDNTTASVDEDGLGFSFKWNSDYNADMKEYLECDPLFRKGRHNQLTFGMVYAYSEKFMLGLGHESAASKEGSLISRLPGEYYQKFSNYKAALAYSTVHPGKKLIFMGQDMGQYNAWNGTTVIDWNCLNYDNHIQINTLVRNLNKLYRSQPALYKMDYMPEGFEWINDMDSDRSVISFIRKTDDKKETLVVVCNFTPVVYENYIVGVPYKARYREIFNSDEVIYGGAGNINTKLKNARKEGADGREFCISVTVPPLGVAVFNCTPIEPAKKGINEVQESENMKSTAKTAAKATSTEKVSTAKTAAKATSTEKVSTAKTAAKATSTEKANTAKTTSKTTSTAKAGTPNVSVIPENADVKADADKKESKIDKTKAEEKLVNKKNVKKTK